jgi:flavin-dependent dehydrogenase
METVAMVPKLAQRLSGAKLMHEVTATGNYSYSASRMYGDRYILIGDAFTFIDPVFSSGVMLAMHSGYAGADAVHAFLQDPTRANARLRRFDRAVRDGVKSFSWFIYRMTSPTVRQLFMAPSN